MFKINGTLVKIFRQFDKKLERGYDSWDKIYVDRQYNVIFSTVQISQE